MKKDASTCPFIVHFNPWEWAGQRAWSSTLIYNSCRGFERLLNKGTSRWLSDCELLIHSKFSSVSLCGTASLGRLLSTDNPWADQLLLVRSGRAKGTPKLRWNFRDRVREGLFLAELLYPETRFAGPKVRRLEQADAGLRLCRLGYEKGYRPVLQAAGPDLLEESPTQGADAARKISSSIIVRAGLGFDMGLTSSESNCELKLAQQTKLLSVEELGQSTDALSAMSVSTACYTSFMRIMQPDLERRLAFQQGLVEEAPNTSEKTAAKTAGIEPNQPPSGQAHEATPGA
jgi:hypothetical protein